MYHGLTNHPTYSVWSSIKTRCYNPKSDNYERYGGRGITMCDEWKNNPLAFSEHVSMLENYGRTGYSIDRICNDGNYEPGNLKWSTRHGQQTNQRTYSNNKSGYVGVSFNKKHEKWRSQITIHGEEKYLGRYNTAKEAAIARDKHINEHGLEEYRLQVL